jgi:hypothetical protein
MLVDIPRCSRVCAATSRELKPGDTFFSVLFEEKNVIKRLDYSLEAWHGPPTENSGSEDSNRHEKPELIGYWKSKVPLSHDTKNKLAPGDILLNFFDQLIGQPEKAEICYVLVLLLIRRRLFRLEKEEPDPVTGKPCLTIYCPKRDIAYSVTAEVPSEERIEELQDTLTNLLY